MNGNGVKKASWNEEQTLKLLRLLSERLKKDDGKTIVKEQLYRDLLDEYKEDFKDRSTEGLRKKLELEKMAYSNEILHRQGTGGGDFVETSLSEARAELFSLLSMRKRILPAIHRTLPDHVSLKHLKVSDDEYENVDPLTSELSSKSSQVSPKLFTDKFAKYKQDELAKSEELNTKVAKLDSKSEELNTKVGKLDSKLDLLLNEVCEMRKAILKKD